MTCSADPSDVAACAIDGCTYSDPEGNLAQGGFRELREYLVAEPEPGDVGLTPDGGHLTGGTAGLTGRMSVCRASVRSTPRSFGSRLPAW